MHFTRHYYQQLTFFIEVSLKLSSTLLNSRGLLLITLCSAIVLSYLLFTFLQEKVHSILAGSNKLPYLTGNCLGVLKSNLKMRPRSKSVCVPSASHKNEDIEDDENLNSEEEEDHKVQNETAKIKGSWTPEEQLTLICQLKKFIPRKDNLPFNERLESIDWFHIEVGNHTLKEIKTEFKNILEKTRTFRLLEEIVKDMHSEILPKLGFKKPQPAFVLFLQDYREEIEKIVQKNPKKGSFTHVGGIMFNECSEDIRESYKQKAKKCKEEYDRLISNYELPKGVRAIKGRTIKYTPMQCFVQAQVLKDPKCSKLQLRKEYSTLPRKQKLKWILRWIGIKKGEKANLDQYLKSLKILTKQEQDILNEYEGRPRYMSAYNMFMRDHLSHKDANASYRENFRSVVAEWKNVPEDVKKEYLAKAKMLKKNFTADFTRFVASLPNDRHDYEIKLLSVKKAGQKNNSKTEGKSDMEAETEYEDEDFEQVQEKSKSNENDDDEYDEDEEYPAEEGDDENQENLNNTTMIVNNTKKDTSKSTVADTNENGDDDEGDGDEDDDDDDDRGSYSYQDDDRNEQIFQCDTSALRQNVEQGRKTESNVNKLAEQEMPKNKRSAPMVVLHSTPVVNDSDDKTTKANQKKTKPKHKQVLIDSMLKAKAPQHAKDDEEEIPPTQPVKPTSDEVAETNMSIKDEPVSDTGSKSPTKSKKRKISIGENNPTETKKVKDSSTSSDVAVDLDKVKDEKTVALEKKYRKILARKPPETLVQWYAKLNFDGSEKKAKKSLNKLTLEEKQSLEADYESTKAKYAKKFKAFAATLDAEELSHFSSLFEAN